MSGTCIEIVKDCSRTICHIYFCSLCSVSIRCDCRCTHAGYKITSGTDMILCRFLIAGILLIPHMVYLSIKGITFVHIESNLSCLAVIGGTVSSAGRLIRICNCLTDKCRCIHTGDYHCECKAQRQYSPSPTSALHHSLLHTFCTFSFITRLII